MDHVIEVPVFDDDVNEVLVYDGRDDKEARAVVVVEVEVKYEKNKNNKRRNYGINNVNN